MNNEQNDFSPINTNVENNSNLNQNIELNNNQQVLQDYYSNNESNNNDNVNSIKYKLILHRKKSFVGAALALDVNVDDQKVGTIKNGETLQLEVTPGSHTVFLSKKNLLVSVDPNNAVNIQVDRDTTADVVVFGSNNFGITNINGQGVDINSDSTKNYFRKSTIKSNLILIVSILIPIISIILFILSKLYVAYWVYGFVIGYAIVNLIGLRLQKDSEHYKSNLSKNIIALILSVIFGLITMYIWINEIESIDELFNKGPETSYVEEKDDDETEDSYDEYKIPDNFKLKFEMPDTFSLDQVQKDSDTKDFGLIYENSDSNGKILNISLMRIVSDSNDVRVLLSLRNGFKEQLKEETNNIADLEYTEGNFNSKYINNELWNEKIDTCTSNNLNLKVTIFTYTHSYKGALYVVYGVIDGDLNLAEPDYSNFINSLKF